MNKKVMDKKNRWRNKTVSFRLSEEENDLINRLVYLSGMSKQDYIISRLENKEMNIQANPRVVKAIRNELRAIVEAATHRRIDEDEREFLGIIMSVVDGEC